MKMRGASIQKIWEWMKIVAKLPRLLPRRHQEDPEPEPHVPTDLERELGEKIQRRQSRELLKTKKHDLPNMPKHQPCPECNRSSKRIEKTVSGAKYKCRKHGEFFVRALGL